MSLRCSVVIDYQNVHLVGHDAFPISRHRPRHECLVDPLLFSQVLLAARNSNQRPGYPVANLARVLVFRGLPSATFDSQDYGRSMAQRAHWKRDPRVEVELRPLRYSYDRDVRGKPAQRPDGSYIVHSKREKGVDVLCALACTREARRPDIDVVILASHDSDLEPAIVEVRREGTAKIETFRWNSPDDFIYQLGSGLPPGQRPWCTRLDEGQFRQTWDLTPYA